MKEKEEDKDKKKKKVAEKFYKTFCDELNKDKNDILHTRKESKESIRLPKRP